MLETSLDIRYIPIVIWGVLFYLHITNDLISCSQHVLPMDRHSRQTDRQQDTNIVPFHNDTEKRVCIWKLIPSSCINNLILYFWAGKSNSNGPLLLAYAEPPLLKDWTDEEIMKLKDQPLILDVGNNTQFMEHLVQTVSLLGSTSTDARIREGFAKAKVAHQKLLP